MAKEIMSKSNKVKMTSSTNCPSHKRIPTYPSNIPVFVSGNMDKTAEFKIYFTNIGLQR